MGIGGVLARGIGRWLGNAQNDAVGPLQAVSKEIAKHGIKSIEPTNPVSRMVRSRAGELVTPPFRMNPDAAVQELAKDTHLRYDYLNSLLGKLHRKDEVRQVIKYVKSTAADNLAPNQRAELLQACLDRLHWIDMIGQFLH